jgi:hypothetical protein
VRDAAEPLTIHRQSQPESGRRRTRVVMPHAVGGRSVYPIKWCRLPSRLVSASAEAVGWTRVDPAQCAEVGAVGGAAAGDDGGDAAGADEAAVAVVVAAAVGVDLARASAESTTDAADQWDELVTSLRLPPVRITARGSRWRRLLRGRHSSCLKRVIR